MTTRTCGLAITAAMYAALLAQLAQRGGGIRESGAFLLAPVGTATNSTAHRVEVTALAYYDDLDPDSLTGGITFHANGYTALAAICRRDRVRVVGDIHTHPHQWVSQSPIDAAHPMSALPGHIALIAPRFAQSNVAVTDLGAHVYAGRGQWRSYFGDDVHAVLRITGRTLLHRAVRRLRDLARRIRHSQGLRRSR